MEEAVGEAGQRRRLEEEGDIQEVAGVEGAEEAEGAAGLIRRPSAVLVAAAVAVVVEVEVAEVLPSSLTPWEAEVLDYPLRQMRYVPEIAVSSQAAQ